MEHEREGTVCDQAYCKAKHWLMLVICFKDLLVVVRSRYWEVGG